MQYIRVSRSLSASANMDAIDVPSCGGSCAPRQLAVTCLYFDRLEVTTLSICRCCPAPLQLIALGLFGCAPVLPSLAVDVRVLELVKGLFVHMTPNMSGWTEALEGFLNDRGYKLATNDNLRRRFSIAYHWYIILALTVAEHVSDLLCCQTPAPDAEDENVSVRENTQPSEYLRSRCPLCFGGKDWRQRRDPSNDIDLIVCVDACFTQKRSRNARNDVTNDPPNPTQTIFISEFDVKAMEAHVEDCRRVNGGRKRSRVLAANGDGYENGMKIPMSVLDACGDSFVAADEKREKASTRYFADTGLMAMLCRHDRVLWLVNMTSAGEKQYYALALLQRLFDHLPSDMSVGLLYDIGCQLERSCRKWRFLSGAVLSRLHFAIAVFHAYGHQWACQVIYHPRKCVGFGLSDGEGCERLWSFLKPLIPVLRVSGFHQRLFVLDYQVRHLHTKSLECFGDWLHRRWMHCRKKMASTTEALALLDVEESVLRDQWAAQVAYQTAPLARQAKNKGEEEINRVLALEKVLEHQQIVIDDLEYQLAVNSVCDVTDLNIRLVEARRKLATTTTLVEKRRAVLGVRMNARALKTRIRERLRQRKFELERLERAYRTTTNENKLQDNVQAAIRRREPTILKLVSNYNTLCKQLHTLIDVGTAPPGAIVPPCISREGIFQLDVDDDLWQDIGLDDATTDPPLWLADECVRMGIRHLLEYDRCVEEEARVCRERCVLQEWMISEWNNLQKARGDAVEEEELTEEEEEEEEEEGQTRLWGINMGDDELMAEVEEAALAYEYQLQGQDDSDEELIRDLSEVDDMFSESHGLVDDGELSFICTPTKKWKF
ncbi:hypothetical protein BU15DRAFT_90847 [Melanogaster broomeanus]|nr:hypothetical protein BU15DRAFT_90847 [Melanogaster broomeanus]